MAKKSAKVTKKTSAPVTGHKAEHVSAASLFLVLCFVAVVVILAITQVNGL